MRFLSPVLSLFLTPCIALSPVWAQSHSAGPAEHNPVPPLQMHVVDEPGPALANSTSAKGYIVQVSDSSGIPVAGAAVALRLPEENPTGRFAGDLRAWVAYTDSAGVARFPTIRWGENPGFVELRATAAKGSVHAGLLIQQQVKGDHPTLAAAPIPQPTVVVAPAPVPVPQLLAAPRILETAPQPGTIFEPMGDIAPPPTAAKSGAAAPKQVLKPNPPLPPQAAPTPEKTVSIINLKTGAGGSGGRSNKKWLIIAAVGTGAGVGALLALKGHASSGTTTSATSGISIGTPTISVGH